jgi:hypothetical protein
MDSSSFVFSPTNRIQKTRPNLRDTTTKPTTSDEAKFFPNEISLHARARKPVVFKQICVETIEKKQNLEKHVPEVLVSSALTTNCCPRRLETDLLDDRAIFAVLLFAMMAQDWVSVKLIFY